MKDVRTLMALVRDGAFDTAFTVLYPGRPAESCRERCISALREFLDQFGNRPAVLVSAPGRTEIGGNHTDHQRGRVLAASVDLDVLCVASPNREMVAEVRSQGHAPAVADLRQLEPRDSDRDSAAGLLRGIAAWFQQHGHPIGGFDAYTTSDVLVGSGLSSSAAFAVAVGNILRALYGGELEDVEIAQAGQYAENLYFGKPSGLMDQTASAVGGAVSIDFADPQRPAIRPIPLALADAGLQLCIVDTGGSHANLTPDYAAIPAEMRSVAAFFGKEVLGELDRSCLRGRFASLRIAVGDRAVLRALHFFEENDRVARMCDALQAGEMSRFLEEVIRSGRSSATLLQNVSTPQSSREQGVLLALAVSESLLDGRGGAWRVHGGGFAGTIQAFVPRAILGEYRNAMDRIFGPGRCHLLSVRTVGGTHINPDN